MLWPTTLIGAGVGYAVADIPGAMLGALLGQALDRRLQLQTWANVREWLGGRSALRDDQLLFVLLGRVAKRDGVVTEGHIRQARHEMAQLRLDQNAQRAAIAALSACLWIVLFGISFHTTRTSLGYFAMMLLRISLVS